MIFLDKPTFDPQQTFLDCISNVNNEDLKTRLAEIVPTVNREAAHYDLQASIKKLEDIRPINPDDTIGRVTTKEAKWVYTVKMVPSKAPGRIYYDKIKLLAKRGLCPLCGVRIVSTLDHHLPKAHYPVFSVVPYNLVPACNDCNKIKSDSVLQSSTEQTLHPYYDNVEQYSWLEAEITRGKPASVRYKVCIPNGCPSPIDERIAHHFDTLKLEYLYGVNAASEILNIAYEMEEVFNSEGAAGVSAHLKRRARSHRKINRNSWSAVLYKTLANDTWYCKEGFRI